jgi:hypothetical protein
MTLSANFGMDGKAKSQDRTQISEDFEKPVKLLSFFIILNYIY